MTSVDRFVRIKRVADVGLVLATTPVWGAAVGLAAAATVVSSGRPAFYRQRRMGWRGRPFHILKVRTMRPGPAPPGAMFKGWTYKDDPRVTPLGRWLRRYRIDELPQLINVLKGDMSLIGPRPEPWEVAVRLGEQIDGYHDRHAVRPGLTGLCQLSPDYLKFGTVELSARKLRHDLRYVRYPKLARELGILARTVGVLARGVGVA